MPARAHLHALIEYNVIQRAVFAYFAGLHHNAVFKAGPLPNVYPAEQYAVFNAPFNYAAVRKQAVFNLRLRAVAGWGFVLYLCVNGMLRIEKIRAHGFVEKIHIVLKIARHGIQPRNVAIVTVAVELKL